MLDIFAKVVLGINLFGKPILAVLTLIFGILIICNSDKITKFLGIFFTANSIGTIVTSIFTLLTMIPGITLGPVPSTVLPFVTIPVSAVVMLSMFLYAKYRYGTKMYLLYIMAGIIAGGAAMVAILTPLISNLVSVEEGIRVSYISSVLSILNSMAVTVMLLLIYFKDRKKEDKLKIFWVYHLITLIFGIYSLVINLIAAIAISSFSQIDLRTMLELFMLIGSELAMFVMPVFAVYVFVKCRRPALEIV